MQTDPHPSRPPFIVPPRPVVFLLGVYALGLILFAAARLVFLLYFSDRLAAVPWPTVLTAFAIGLRFDTVVLAAVLVPAALALPFLGRRFQVPGYLLGAYLVLVMGLIFLLLLGDIRFFEEYDTHLNFNVFDYLTEGRTAWNLILFDPSFWTLVAVWAGLVGALVAGVIALRRLTRSLTLRRSLLHTVVWTLILLALGVLGIRGRVDLAPIDWGVAYFSHDQFVNQLSLNGAYTLGRTLTERDHDPRLIYRTPAERWPFVDLTVALDTVRSMLGLPHETWLEPETSLRRLAHQDTATFGFQPNIVLVVMESFSGRNTGILGSPRDLTPHFDSLARHGLLFTNCYATGTRTSYGLAGIIGSFPSLPGRAILKRYGAVHPFVTLSELLHRRGYFNAFLYGGDLVFDNMAGFFKTKGYNLILGEDDFGPDSSFSKWGLPDHTLFHWAADLADTLPRPFQMTLLTLSNHTPFDLPDSSVRRYLDGDRFSRIYNAQLYADWALGQLMASFSRRGVFDSTIFVFTADHALWDNARYILDPVNMHVPLLFYSPRLLGDTGRVISAYSGHCDIIPTLMGLLGGDYIHESWGRDILRLPPHDSGFTVFNHSRLLGYLDPRHFLMDILGERSVVMATDRLGAPDAEVTGRNPEADTLLLTRLHHFVQAAEQLSLPPDVRRETAGRP